MTHRPVLLDQAINYLDPKDGIYVDCTFGAGGYSRSILEFSPSSRVVAIDQDPTTKTNANKLSEEFGARFTFVQDNFANLQKILYPIGLVDGIIWDLGVSSMQLDEAERGFSFMKDANLDMRMSMSGLSAADFLNSAAEKEIADVIYHYGDEVHSRKIAKKIIEMRQIAPLTTTKQLAEIARSVVKKYNYKIDAATKTFQAIRIFVNDELRALESSLYSAKDLLRANGRLVLVSFHSLEDRIIKDYFKEHSVKKVATSKYQAKEFLEGTYQLLTHKPILPLELEVEQNPRARSAKLRAVKKIDTL
jgi:16S rRNA (cytosine1402-N4)-methyltransferase